MPGPPTSLGTLPGLRRTLGRSLSRPPLAFQPDESAFQNHVSLASSYWHGDADSDRLTRVYGTAFFRKEHLQAHLDAREEAKARDHRVLGKKLGLFHLDETVGSGLVLWTPNGATLRQCLQDFITEELDQQGYRQVFTPHIGKLDLYRTSGHFPYYRESQFPPILITN